MSAAPARQTAADEAANVAVTVEGGWHPAEAAGPALRAAAATLAHAAPATSVELSLLLTGDARMRALNRDYRGRNQPTNVLAFPAETAASGVAPRLLGDVVVAYETAAREARAAGKPLADHLCHLVVHGTLHLLGYDHGINAEAEAMEALERRILHGLGIDDLKSPGVGSTAPNGNERTAV